MAEFIKSSACPKIIDVIKNREDKWISLEFFPPKTDAGVTNLYGLMDKYKKLCSNRYAFLRP